jgi:hypothetical protein
LISNVLKGGSDVDFFAAFGEPIQNHVYEDIGSRATDSIAAVDNYGARPASVGLVDFSAEL